MKRDSRVVAIIQARTGSTRLPGKVLMPIAGKPMLWHVIDRLKNCKNVDSIVVATTNRDEDKPLLEIAKESSVETFAGSEDDVLDRYYQAAKKFYADVIVRITADCPLLDPKIVDDVVDYYRNNAVDYVNTGPSFPEGVDTEIFSFNALETAWKNAKRNYEREHPSIYIHEHPEKFKLAKIENKKDMSHICLTVDRAEDLIVVRKVFERLYKEGEVFHMQEVLDFLEKNPEIMEINREVLRNEGFLSSLKKEGLDIDDPNAPYREWVSKYMFQKKGKQEREE